MAVSLEEAEVKSGAVKCADFEADSVGTLCEDDLCLICALAGESEGPVGLGSARSELFSLVKRGEAPAEWRDGTVLLRCIPLPMVAGLPIAGDDVTAAPTDPLEPRDETDTFLLILPHLCTLSAPALAFELDLPSPALVRPGGDGEPGEPGAGAPLCTSMTVFSSAAVPCIPIRNESWFSIKKISTSWLRRYSFGAMSC